MKKSLHPKLEGTKLEDFTPIDEVAELQTIDLKEGDGEVCPEGATVRIHYTGARCKDGVIFQSSIDMGKAIPLSLHQVIEGWQQGVPGMKVGGKRRIIIPHQLAYGAHSPAPNIPKYADLVFDIELFAVS